MMARPAGVGVPEVVAVLRAQYDSLLVLAAQVAELHELVENAKAEYRAHLSRTSRPATDPFQRPAGVAAASASSSSSSSGTAVPKSPSKSAAMALAQAAAPGTHAAASKAMHLTLSLHRD
jgi:transcription elongation factor